MEMCVFTIGRSEGDADVADRNRRKKDKNSE